MLEELTGKPVIGVIPYFEDIFIEQEDAVVIDHCQAQAADKRINIAVILLRHMSNFTDFNTLEQLPDVHLYYTNRPEEIAKADIVIIPGSKNVISDLTILRSGGVAKAIQEHHLANKPLYGICGGYQMMGTWVHDPLGIEGEIESFPGLGILPVVTTLAEGKTTRQCQFTLLHAEGGGEGYEIHAGETPTSSPFTQLNNGEQEGYYLNEQTWGSYIHGIFDNESVVNLILKQVNGKLYSELDYKAQKEQNYDRLADWVRKHIDMEYVYKTMEL